MQNVSLPSDGLTRPRPMKRSRSTPSDSRSGPEVLVDEGGGEAVVAGRHGRVGGEDDLRRDAAQGFPRVDAFDDHALADDLERGERAVAFVEMEDARRDAERRQGAHAADAEQQFLPDADAVVAAVEPRRQLPILGLVALDVRVEEEERVAADRELPDARRDRVRSGCRPRSVTGTPWASAGRIGSDRWSTSM